MAAVVLFDGIRVPIAIDRVESLMKKKRGNYRNGCSCSLSSALNVSPLGAVGYLVKFVHRLRLLSLDKLLHFCEVLDKEMAMN